MRGKNPGRQLKFGILPKMILSFLAISMLPIFVLFYFANKNMTKVGLVAGYSAETMSRRHLEAATELGKNAIQDSVRALDEKSTEAIELRTVELADRIADFLHERDKDVLCLASLKPEADRYLEIYNASRRDIIIPGAHSGESKAETKPAPISGNPENRTAWRHHPPYGFRKESRPLYREITFVDPHGRERIKIKDGRISSDLRDISIKESTYCRAEDYFAALGRLKKDEIYVSRVIGPYVRGWLNMSADGVRVSPDSAYAGSENPGGGRFEGIIRWAAPVFGKDGTKIGYVTLALDHTHIMEFTDHVAPTDVRFSEMPDGGSGNYAFLWDDRDRCIAHAREFFICGYDPKTGEEVPGWVSQETHDEFKKSGLSSLGEFVKHLPSFRDFSMSKKGSKEQMAAGEIGLDCRILDNAPQCEGWHDGTRDGGSGSFLIYWTGLWKLTTYATVPYYTGIYGNSKRGFGYVTIGANVDAFHQAASVTKAYIEKNISEQGMLIHEESKAARAAIGKSMTDNRRLMVIISIIPGIVAIGASIIISLTITKPLRRLTEGALAIRRGELNQYIEVASRDETGRLAEAFNEMAAAVAEVDRMKSEFVTTASHELRTPIHSMLLGVSGLLGGYAGEIGEEAKEDLLIVEEGIERLRRLVDNLLDLSRIESRKIEMNIADVSVGDVVDTAIDELAGLIEAHGHKVDKVLPGEVPPIMADRDRLIQLLVNLLSNSIKYTPEHGRILVRCESRDEHLIFTVADNGYGIPAWAQKKVFDRFFQADQIMSQKVGGTGLGLTISRWIVQEHDGIIHLQSPLSKAAFPSFDLGGQRKGTAFFVRLPIKRM
jgi:signal transduction histidine kinase